MEEKVVSQAVCRFATTLAGSWAVPYARLAGRLQEMQEILLPLEVLAGCG